MRGGTVEIRLRWGPAQYDDRIGSEGGVSHGAPVADVTIEPAPSEFGSGVSCQVIALPHYTTLL